MTSHLFTMDDHEEKISDDLNNTLITVFEMSRECGIKQVGHANFFLVHHPESISNA